MSAVLAASVAVASFLAMELVAALGHRYVMHRSGMRWHRSHHVANGRGPQGNDLFPVVGAAGTIALFAVGAWTPLHWATWIAIGTTGYGIAYFLVHEVYVHRRIPVRLPRWRYLEWVRDAHRVHHAQGCAPYGFVVPVIGRDAVERARQATRDPLGPTPVR